MGVMQRTITPIDDLLYVGCAYAAPAEIDATLATARRAAGAWKRVPVADPPGS
jgi:hypothetical protein